jgi:HJR/Mrr/RecB family endonuclease
MDGREFEEAVKELLELLGFENVEMTERFDRGADLICVRDGVRIAVQVKRRASAVGKDAVLQLWDGMAQYECNGGLLVTNSFLTPPAIERAARYRIEVWDRRRIAGFAAGDEPTTDLSRCAECGAAISEGVAKYCLDQPSRFGGLAYCMAHQARSRRS